ncbi:MAG: DUF2288 family protein [Cyanobacteria bacterium J06642_2]
MDDLRAALVESLAPAQWEWLRPHAVDGRMVLVSVDLDLIDVGVAVAQDATAIVQGWLESGSLIVADAAEIARRDAGAATDESNALIVQPFVLVQDLVAPPGPAKV